MKPPQWARGIGPRLVAFYLRPAFASRPLIVGALIAMVVAVGIGDYLAGIEISLAIFYLVPITLATAWLGWRAGLALLVASICARLIGDALTVRPLAMPFHTWWNVLATTVVSLFVLWLLHSLLSLHREIEAKVIERTGQLQEAMLHRERLEREILDVGARERSAIGRELHDDLGQHLTATALAAQTLVQQLGEHPEAARARSIVAWIEEGTAKARNLARGLLLAHVEPERLPQELRELSLSASQGPTRVRFIFQGHRLAADGAECAQLLRIAQEAVGNALRHGEAKTVEIALASDANGLLLTISDDGRGFAEPAAGNTGEGFGLRIMKHRAKIIGGTISFFSQPGKGTKVVCRLPRSPAVPA